MATAFSGAVAPASLDCTLLLPTTHKTILVVGHNSARCYAATRLLQTAGYAVVNAASREEAWAAAQQHPDLILLHLDAFDLGLIEVCRKLKHNGRTKIIPVVVLGAGHANGTAADLRTSCRADAFLLHPATLKELLSVIAGTIARAAAAQAGKTPSACGNFCTRR